MLQLEVSGRVIFRYLLWGRALHLPTYQSPARGERLLNLRFAGLSTHNAQSIVQASVFEKTPPRKKRRNNV